MSPGDFPEEEVPRAAQDTTLPFPPPFWLT